jgi:hypothetical protein
MYESLKYRSLSTYVHVSFDASVVSDNADQNLTVLQYVALLCSVVQCVAVCCSVPQGVAVCCSVPQCAAVRCSALQCVAVCCSVLQRVAATYIISCLTIQKVTMV